MKKSRFTEEQMVGMLRDADRTTVAELSKKYKVSDQTLYGWRKRFGQLEPADVKRLRALEAEASRSASLRAKSSIRPIWIWLVRPMIRVSIDPPTRAAERGARLKSSGKIAGRMQNPAIVRNAPQPSFP